MKSGVNSIFSNKIRRLQEARLAAGVKLKDLASQTGYGVATISNVESGRRVPSARLVEAIVRVLWINKEWLETGSGQMFCVRHSSPGDPTPALPPHLQVRLDKIGRAISSNQAEFESLKDQFGIIEIQPGFTQNQGLTDISSSGKNPPVTMRDLLARLREATAERGMKTKLAKAMGVPPANVSQWLSGVREPSGETTLRLLQWVQEQERTHQ